MWNKIVKWFKENINNFLATLFIVLAIIFIIAYLPKWLVITLISVIFALLLVYKIWKDQPF